MSIIPLISIYSPILPSHQKILELYLPIPTPEHFSCTTKFLHLNLMDQLNCLIDNIFKHLFQGIIMISFINFTKIFFTINKDYYLIHQNYKIEHTEMEYVNKIGKKRFLKVKKHSFGIRKRYK